MTLHVVVYEGENFYIAVNANTGTELQLTELWRKRTVVPVGVPLQLPGLGVAELQCQVPACFCFDGFSASCAPARLAQSAERKALNLVVVGSSPTVGVLPFPLGWRSF